MSLRKAVKDLRRGTSSSGRTPPSNPESSRSSSCVPATTTEDVGTCPAYHPITSSHIQPSDPNSSQSFFEDTHSDFDSEEAPPPYMLLSNGDRKPEYSRSDPAKTTDANISRMDGALCLRCNARKAKAWYLRQAARTSQ
ncbi:uncharacterized protein Z519_12749 [Cladophialophora bantiana CBS 173.52]|uniref:Uncharacterized protein n=1 Tax=Cladophialophora bantiana (strain ATCC 10958 / CBS 173.52 / CDC B-1940 / NIH 8579) TaxID=1442370 RepID=A0A0D2HQA1_CLAB1|nr:uncharacterized protein Z519_12749 [Cladophialophora bantiana CBS 173.52]KIW86624.1 hypothetical protein Z519_12749 [Cladophialophora bantiana CBS 173.52]